MSLTSLTVTELLDAFASSAPTPGGGSASALAGATGAALLAMVAAMPKTKTGADSERKTLDLAAASLERLRKRLAELIDEDTKAYDLVSAAFKHPKGTDEEKAGRKTAIQSGMRAATKAPLETMRACDAVLREAVAVVQYGNPNAASDAAVGMELAQAALRGAEKNVAINLGSLTDEEFKLEAESEAAALLVSGCEQAEICRQLAKAAAAAG